jgi:hypothetical protein
MNGFFSRRGKYNGRDVATDGIQTGFKWQVVVFVTAGYYCLAIRRTVDVFCP